MPMSVTGFHNAADFCFMSKTCVHQVGLIPRHSFSFEGNHERKDVAMTSSIHAQQVNKDPLKLTGDSFIRQHLRKLAPYQPILPFEVGIIKIYPLFLCIDFVSSCESDFFFCTSMAMRFEPKISYILSKFLTIRPFIVAYVIVTLPQCCWSLSVLSMSKFAD